jgi:methyl-accepting chemotaxis protein
MIVLRRIIISPLQQVVLDVQRPIDLSFKVSYPPGHEKDEIGALVTAVNASIER